MTYEVAVLGLGGMGSAALAHCAARGVSCVGLEQFTPAHDFGSSHGMSRLIRKAYFEDPAYVPLLERAYHLWRELERETAEELFCLTGLLTVGEEGNGLIEGTRRAAREHNLPLQSWSRAETQARYPTLQLQPAEVAVFEPEGGVVFPERTVRAHQQVAAARGAEMRFEVAMERWEALADGFKIHLSDGSEVACRKLILTLGPWLKETLESLGVTIRVQRNVQAWFKAGTDVYDASRFPAFLLDRRDWPAPLYGMPDFGEGLKTAFHGLGPMTEPGELEREIDYARDVEPLVRGLEQWMPGAATNFRAASACMYTLTPDEHFIVDRHPAHPNLILLGGFSGHGFKFAPIVGEIAADLAVAGATRHQIDFLSLRRFR